MKRTLLLILIFLPMLASAQDDAVKIDGIYYNLDSEAKTAEVTENPYKYEGNITIPETVKYDDVVYSITAIGEGTFSGCSKLNSITIPNSVTSIKGFAFSGCNGLTSITIPNSVTAIGDWTFSDCRGLTSITIPSSVTSIGNSAFFMCRSLTSITIPSNVTSIESQTFAYCGLTSITIPNSVTSIGEYAFGYCSDLASITIPNSVTTIGEHAFENCISLTSISIPSSVTSIGNDAFWGCRELISITIPNSVIEIGSYVFSDCSGLTSVTIPNSVTSIGDGAFEYCRGLLDFYCYAENVPGTASNIFKGSNIGNATLHVPAASISAYQAVEPWKNFKEIVALSDQAPQNEYRPLVEEDKVWIVRVSGISPDGSPMEPYIEYCYLDGDTIIGGQTCKRMMCGTNDTPSPFYLGAWYEQDKKVYFSHDGHPFELLYDFTLSSGDNINLGDFMFVVEKKSGGITGFKGTYYDIRHNDKVIERWLESVGSESLPFINHPHYFVGAGGTLLACIVGDEVLYYNNEEEDPYVMGARKRRIDFTHTIKIQPKARIKREKNDACIGSSEREVARPKVKARTRNGAEESMYGEYNDQQLCINIDPLDDTYFVCITDESGKAVYEKNIYAGNIVGLNIDISAYPEGRYAITMENSHETFTGEFEAQTTGIKEVSRKQEVLKNHIYNLQGQRLDTLQKGLNIVNGQKVFVK